MFLGFRYSKESRAPQSEWHSAAHGWAGGSVHKCATYSRYLSAHIGQHPVQDSRARGHLPQPSRSDRYACGTRKVVTVWARSAGSSPSRVDLQFMSSPASRGNSRSDPQLGFGRHVDAACLTSSFQRPDHVRRSHWPVIPISPMSAGVTSHSCGGGNSRTVLSYPLKASGGPRAPPGPTPRRTSGNYSETCKEFQAISKTWRRDCGHH